MIKKCIVCSKEFRTFPCRKKSNCCSIKCKGINDRGRVPWNKGKKCPSDRDSRITKNCPICRKEFKTYIDQIHCSAKCYGKSLEGIPINIIYPKDYISPLKGRKRPRLSGINNSAWKGEKAKYIAKHAWVYRHKGRPQKCEHCRAENRKLHWANIDHKYRRELSDYISLCVPCHRKYDYNVISALKP